MAIYTSPELASTSADTKEKMHQQDIELFPTASHAVGETIVGSSGTKRGIRSRQAQMIAIGGSIGTSLFISTGQALAIGGPG